MLAIVVAGLGALFARDVKMKGLNGRPADAATDALIMGTTIVLSQLYFVATNPAFATLLASELAHGVFLATFSVALWRLTIYLATRTNDPGKLPDFKVFSAALAGAA